MEVHEKLRSISDARSQSTLRWHAGHVPRAKNLTCKLTLANFNFAVRPQPQKPLKFVDRENFMSYGNQLCMNRRANVFIVNFLAFPCSHNTCDHPSHDCCLQEVENQ